MQVPAAACREDEYGRGNPIVFLPHLAVSGMSVYTAPSFVRNSFAYQPTCKLQPNLTRAKRATWLNGAKEYHY